MKRGLKFTLFFAAFIMTFLNSPLMLRAEPEENAHMGGEEFLDLSEKKSFDFFWKETNEDNGLTRNTTEPNSPVSIASCGFALTAIPIAIERGWITKDEGYARALLTLKTFRDDLENEHGFYYHFVDFKTGRRAWRSEISCIDTALFLAGALFGGEYFKGTEIEAIAKELYERADWAWFTNGTPFLHWAWSPERGFEGKMSSYSEVMLSYILAIGSPAHPIPVSSWDVLKRPIGLYDKKWIIYADGGSLFTYQFPHAWVDFRNKHDKFVDYWENSKKAVEANRQFCIDNMGDFKTYGENLWGISASLGPSGYKAYGAEPGKGIHDGTIAPYAVAASIPFAPELAVTAYRNMYDVYKDKIWGDYGFTDALNLDRKWYCKYFIGIDKGIELLMIENYRSGFVWKYFMKLSYINDALGRIGFKEGKQLEPSIPKEKPGNPGARMNIKKLNFTPSVDGNFSEWEGSESLELTTRNNRNVELDLGTVDSDKDASGTAYLGWDDQHLYLACKVEDDDIVVGSKPNEIYKDDCVEVFLDLDLNGFYFDNNPMDFQWGFAPGGEKSLCWAWGPIQAKPKGTEYIVKKTDTGYIVEAAIPFKEIGGLNPYSVEEMRFTVSIHDRDSDKSEGKLTWSIDKESAPDVILFGRARFVH